MDTLFSLKVFRQVVQSGSFTRAAEQLGISTAMASKHVSHLENSIRAKLLHRNSRNLHLTEAGEAYYRQCSYALDTLHSAAEQAAAGTDTPQGVLRITMPLWFACPPVSRWLAEYRSLYPAVELDLSLSNRSVDLIADGFDLALRVSDEPHPSLIVRPLTEIEFYLLAAPDYLRRHGTPQTPQQVAGHQAVLPSYVDKRHIEVHHRTSGERAAIELKPVAGSDNTLMVGRMIEAGIGIGYQPAWAVEDELAAGRLVRLLPDYRLFGATLYAAYVDRAFLSAKVRSFIDFFAQKTQEAV
ncbi:DNA-binding transcriptional LysR family regulator [Neisseria sp. HSC-16F19]|nr:LysR family transcriptional regulator [Neisseria sp. HSC-16F19]MCP2041295.1 DNA-binding transcriptional LysR family regulator [Neisseria sp. HSC-16F19]